MYHEDIENYKKLMPNKDICRMQFKAIAALLLSFFTLCSAQAQRPAIKKILFIGNSYTAVNDLPNWTKQVAESLGDTFEFTAISPGGTTFKRHSTDPQVLAELASGAYDAIVLQEQSQLPSFPPQQVEAECFPYAKTLVDSARSAKKCVQILFYMTWGRQNGDASNCAFWPPVCTFAGMNELLRQSYIAMAKDNKANVAPVASVWRDVRASSSIELYQGDGSHPSAAGTHLAAMTIYRSLFSKDVSSTAFHPGITDTDHNLIRGIANRIVKDSSTLWQYDTCYAKKLQVEHGAKSGQKPIVLWHIENQTLNIDWGRNAGMEYRIVDVLGRVWAESPHALAFQLSGKASEERKTTLQINHWIPGQYFLVTPNGTKPLFVP